jgi:hypothetical protein
VGAGCALLFAQCLGLAHDDDPLAIGEADMTPAIAGASRFNADCPPRRAFDADCEPRGLDSAAFALWGLSMYISDLPPPGRPATGGLRVAI